MGTKSKIGYIRAERVIGNLDLGAGNFMAAPAGIIGAFNTSGHVFFVDGVNGLNTNSGTDPAHPVQTITYALSLCVSARDDYIFVFSNVTPEPAWPIVINKTFVHIIGIGHNPDHRPSILAVGDFPVFLISSNSNKAEIAGFRLSGGANHGCIENAAGTPMGVYIHDCLFGHSFDAPVPQDGIRIEANATALRVERCKFFGTNYGRITRDGIRWAGAGLPLSGSIVDCLFNGLPGVGINGVSNMNDIEIINNRFGYPVDNAGAAITMAANCHRNFVTGNRANIGKAVAGAVIAYVDAAVDNTWVENYKALTLQLPA